VTDCGFALFEPEAVSALAESTGFADVQTRALQGHTTRGDYVTLLEKA
jgi:hypothetical protein